MSEKKTLSFDDAVSKYKSIVNILEDPNSYDNNKKSNQSMLSLFFNQTFNNMYTDLKNIKQEDSNDLQNIVNKYGTTALEYCENNHFFSDKQEIANITFDKIGE